MSQETDFIVVKPDLQYKSAPEADITLQVGINQTQSEIIEYDRTVSVNLATLFDAERQKATTFRPTIKISYIYENNLVGHTDYTIFRDSLFYVNPEVSIVNGIWSGLPSFQEFCASYVFTVFTSVFIGKLRIDCINDLSF